METYLELSKAAQDQVIEAIKQSQKIAAQGAEAWADAVKPYAAGWPAATSTPAGVPTPAEIVEQSFGFAQQLLATQREFAQELTAAWTPLWQSDAKAKRGTTASA